MHLNHKNLYKHTNRTWHNQDGARGKGYAEKRPEPKVDESHWDATLICPNCGLEEMADAWGFIHDNMGKGYFCPDCGERFTWTELCEIKEIW